MVFRLTDFLFLRCHYNGFENSEINVNINVTFKVLTVLTIELELVHQIDFLEIPPCLQAFKADYQLC